MATLYEIDRAILDCIDAETGEIIDANALAALSMERDEKIENVALWYKNLVSDAAQYKAEKDAFAAKEKAAKNKAESLKRFLDNALAGSSYKSPRVAVTFRKSEQIVVEDVYAVDERFLKYLPPEADKTAIKAAIKAGETITGAHIEEKQNIQIK